MSPYRWLPYNLQSVLSGLVQAVSLKVDLKHSKGMSQSFLESESDTTT